MCKGSESKMIEYSWKDQEHNSSYYYSEHDGMIHAHVHNIVHTKIWIAKIVKLNPYNQEQLLGQYISQEHAKRAVERWFRVEEKTLIS